MGDFVTTVVTDLITAATELLQNLYSIFDNAILLVYDASVPELTPLGLVIVATAGFALAWAGIRFIFGFISRLLKTVRGGSR